MSNADMNPDVSPEEQDEAEESLRERLEILKNLEPASDPGEIRARVSETAEIERRIRESEERRRAPNAKAGAPDNLNTVESDNGD